MLRTMEKKEFNELLSTYGADISAWPVAEQAAAMVFAGTDLGRETLLAEIELSRVFTADIAIGDAQTTDLDVDAFFARLEAIPDRYSENTPQGSQKLNGWIETIRRFFAGFDIDMSPTMLVSQVAVLAVVLGMGMMVGFTGGAGTLTAPESLQAEPLDISESWFIETEDLVEDTGALEE